MEGEFETVSQEAMIDRHIGKIGTARRYEFEDELRMDVLGHGITHERKDNILFQAQLLEDPARLLLEV